MPSTDRRAINLLKNGTGSEFMRVPHPSRRVAARDNRLMLSPGWVGDGGIQRDVLLRPGACTLFQL
jgi:hypothetical protein